MTSQEYCLVYFHSPRKLQCKSEQGMEKREVLEQQTIRRSLRYFSRERDEGKVRQGFSVAPHLKFSFLAWAEAVFRSVDRCPEIIRK